MESERGREGDRQTDRQRKRETKTETERQKERQTERKDRDRETDRQTDRQTETDRQRQTERQRQRETETEISLDSLESDQLHRRQPRVLGYALLHFTKYDKLSAARSRHVNRLYIFLMIFKRLKVVCFLEKTGNRGYTIATNTSMNSKDI